MVQGSNLLRGAAGWVPAAAVRPFGRPVALFFHGVVERRHDPRIEINHHEIHDFRSILGQLKARFDILPLTELDDALRHPKRHARTVFLMSDDGYLNTSTVAASILAEFGLPWTLFVSSKHIDTGEPNPLTLARLFFYHAPNGRYVIPNLDLPVELGGDRQSHLARLIAGLKSLSLDKAREAVAGMRAAFSDDHLADLLARFPSEIYLNWQEVAKLHDGGVEIGAHADWHWPMNAAQTPDDLREQARMPRQAILARLGTCRYFAYPFGNKADISADAWKAVRDAGYSHAFTTMTGSLDGGANPWLLPRYGLKAQEPRLNTLLPLLRTGNDRLLRWQERLA